MNFSCQDQSCWEAGEEGRREGMKEEGLAFGGTGAQNSSAVRKVQSLQEAETDKLEIHFFYALCRSI